MTNYTTILWDLDGTIINSSPGVYESFNHTFKTLGMPELTPAEMKPFMGPPLRTTFGQILGMNHEQTEEALAIYRDFYLKRGGALNCHLYPGVIETIQKSKAAGVTNSLATSKAERGTKIVGEHFDFLKYFDVLGTASNDEKRNTKADVITYAMGELQKINADLSKVILIGDRIHDIEGARAHGIEVCLVKWGFGDEEEWAEADYLVSNAKELEEVLGL
jgi:phosphoglycolate phosphatase